MPKTLIINTGGTIDAEPYGESPPEFSVRNYPSLVTEAIKLAGGTEQEYMEWPKWDDSKNYTEADYAQISGFINESERDRFIILHGTDRMVEFAQFLKRVVKPNKTVLVTGAMMPLSNGAVSDGWKNIQFALNQIALEARSGAGVAIAFHEQVFDPDNTKKNYSLRRFESAAKSTGLDF